MDLIEVRRRIARIYRDTGRRPIDLRVPKGTLAEIRRGVNPLLRFTVKDAKADECTVDGVVLVEES
jgi:hypothetical protein